MDYKERCYNWVEARKLEDENGFWWEVEPDSDNKVGTVFKTEEALDDYLWGLALEGVIG